MPKWSGPLSHLLRARQRTLRPSRFYQNHTLKQTSSASNIVLSPANHRVRPLLARFILRNRLCTPTRPRDANWTLQKLARLNRRNITLWIVNSIKPWLQKRSQISNYQAKCSIRIERATWRFKVIETHKRPQISRAVHYFKTLLIAIGTKSNLWHFIGRERASRNRWIRSFTKIISQKPKVLIPR
jgi:hypothetical protein